MVQYDAILNIPDVSQGSSTTGDLGLGTNGQPLHEDYIVLINSFTPSDGTITIGSYSTGPYTLIPTTIHVNIPISTTGSTPTGAQNIGFSLTYWPTQTDYDNNTNSQIFTSTGNFNVLAPSSTATLRNPSHIKSDKVIKGLFGSSYVSGVSTLSAFFNYEFPINSTAAIHVKVFGAADIIDGYCSFADCFAAIKLDGSGNGTITSSIQFDGGYFITGTTATINVVNGQGFSVDFNGGTLDSGFTTANGNPFYQLSIEALITIYLNT